MKCEGLTRRQTEVAERVARGMPDKRIAADLHISVDTVRFHIKAASAAIPGNIAPRYKFILFFLNIVEPDEKAG